MLNEKKCPSDTLNLAFNCPWKVGIYCETNANRFLRTTMLHL